MTTIAPSALLRIVLKLDALSCLATGALMLFGATFLDGLLGLPAGLLEGAGLILLPFAAVVWVLAGRSTLPRLAVWAVVAVNALWVVESIALLLSGWVAPTGLGIAFVIVQAVAVAALAELEVIGLWRSQSLEAPNALAA